MGSYKEENGHSRVGGFLKTAAPELLKIVGELTGIDSVGTLFSAITGSKELSDHDKVKALELLELDKKEIEGITKRWEADSISDSWLSKNVRPMVLVFLVFVTSLFCFLDSVSTGFNVKDNWVDLFSLILLSVIAAYFGGRSFEKIKKIIK